MGVMERIRRAPVKRTDESGHGRIHRAMWLDQVEAMLEPTVDGESGALAGMRVRMRVDCAETDATSRRAAGPAWLRLSLYVDTLRAALEYHRYLGAAGDDFFISLALDVDESLSEDLAVVLKDALAQAGLSRDQLEVEFCGQALQADSDATCAAVRRLNEIGVHSSIDLGESGELPAFPEGLAIDRVKVAFGTRSALLEQVVHEAYVRGIRVTATGIESPRELELSRTMSIDRAEGSVLGAAISRADLRERMTERRERRSAAAARTRAWRLDRAPRVWSGPAVEPHGARDRELVLVA
jgi:EAL domain-containing protein (putative c-di-GMP-specific phosphodiesterase class I)